MILATMPPMTELRQEFTRPTTTAVKVIWTEAATDHCKTDWWWKEIVFSRIAKFEKAADLSAGTFIVSDRAASKVRSGLSKVSLQSLPLPTIVPLSGNGLSLAWSSGRRAVEVTAFADGEIAIDALDEGRYVELPEDGDFEAALNWLIVPTGVQPHNAAAR
jgi:hypothetical protein